MLNLTQLHEILPREYIKQNEPMKNHTSFKIGGCADFLVIPHTNEQLKQLLLLCKESDTPFFVMGNGTNLLVAESGIRGLVIKTTALRHIHVDGMKVSAGAGVLLSRLATEALKHSLTGLEFSHGIPGTFGGGIVMNAGAYGGELKEVIVETTYLNENGELKKQTEHQFSYRHSIFSDHPEWIVLEGTVLLKQGNAAEIRARMDELALARRTKQPIELPSAGSVFKRPEGYFAGKLIEDCGLRGYSVGDAQVSPKHCGFIVNNRHATADDVLKLIEEIQQKVKSQYGVDMNTEIKYIGGK